MRARWLGHARNVLARSCRQGDKTEVEGGCEVIILRGGNDLHEGGYRGTCGMEYVSYYRECLDCDFLAECFECTNL